MDDRDLIGSAYLDHLTDADLSELVHAGDVAGVQAQARIQALRSSPGLILDVLDRPAVSAGLLGLSGDGDRFTLVSPFLVFAAAIHRIAADLSRTGYAPERTMPRLRVPVFDGPQLAQYLANPAHRLYLIELLASFARSSGGVIITRTPRGLHRRRWNDLDLSRLAMLLRALPERDRPAVWRRLGDLALFLTGVFPAAIERALAGRLDPARLALTTGLPAPPDPDFGPAELFEWFGAGWYRLAASRYQAGPGRDRSGLAEPGLAQPGLVQPGLAQPGRGRSGTAGTGSAGTGSAGTGLADTGSADTGSRAGGDRQPAVAVIGSGASRPASSAALRDSAAHFHQARRVLNAAADRYLFPAGADWFSSPA